MHAMGSSLCLRLGDGRPDDGGGDGGAGKTEQQKTDPVPVFIWLHGLLIALCGGRPAEAEATGGAGKAEREKTDPVPVFIHRFLFIWAKGGEQNRSRPGFVLIGGGRGAGRIVRDREWTELKTKKEGLCRRHVFRLSSGI